MDDGLIGTWLSRLLGYEERYFPMREQVETGKFIARFIELHAHYEVLGVAGEFPPIFYESPEFKSAVSALVRRAWEKSGKQAPSIKFISGKEIPRIRNENPYLLELAEKGMAEVYLLPFRPKYHFTCIDGRSLFIQETHEHGLGAGTYFMEHTFSLGRESVTFSVNSLRSTAFYLCWLSYVRTIADRRSERLRWRCSDCFPVPCRVGSVRPCPL